ncbi:MAG: DUF4349 domain-containing protein [Acholeplasmatales bacterium]
MKRFFTILLMGLLMSFLLVGCGKANVGPDDGSGASDSPIISETAPERKIIYTVKTTLYEKNINASANNIKALMQDDDFLESETREDTRIYLKLRIKTSRLNDFVAALRNNYDVTSFRLTSEDISFQYQDLTNRKVTYQKEYARLQALLETASFDQIMAINTRLSQLEVLISGLEDDLSLYDSLIEFSTVEVYINESALAPTKGFSGKVGRQIETGWNSMVKFVQFIILVIMTLIPWLVLAVPVTGIVLGSIYLNKYLKKRKEQAKNEPKE